MIDVWKEPWIWPAIIVAIGLPALLVLTTEIAAYFDKRANPVAKVIRLIRNFVLPLAALLILLTQIDAQGVTANSAKLTSTVLGLVVILALLSTLNIALFTTARQGSWRQRVPSIFIDLLRLLIIVICLAILFSWVWGADVGGLFTALGVSSIVIGLALQNAAGSVVSGLLLLFEQPFQLGDWLDLGGTRGRVVEVNWRAVHLDTGNGIQIVPTSTLASSTFTNLSKTTNKYSAQITVTFSTDDAPDEVKSLLQHVAEDLPHKMHEQEASVNYLGASKFTIDIPLRGPADEGPTTGAFLSRLWYASRREELHLDGDTTDNFRSPENLEDALRSIAPVLRLSPEEATALASHCTLEKYGYGEKILDLEETPTGMWFILSGHVDVYLRVDSGQPLLRIDELTESEALGLGAFTRQRSQYLYRSHEEVSLLKIPIECIDQLISDNPKLASSIGKASDLRRTRATEALKTHTKDTPKNRTHPAQRSLENQRTKQQKY